MAAATSFVHVLLRLKEQLGVETDRDAATALGMTDKAFNARKLRGSFPEDKLFALAAKRPELGIDAQYVLTGHRTPGSAGAKAAELARLASELEAATPDLQGRLAALAAQAIRQKTVEERRAEQYDRLRLYCNAMDDERYELVHKLAECLARDSVHVGKAPDR
jgi:hypothetical protein